MLGICDKIVNCIIIAYTMGISALRKGILSMKSDFLRLSLCISTKMEEQAFHTTLAVAFAVSLGCPFDP